MAFEGIILDVDGTVVRDDEPIDGAAEGLDAVADAGLERVFVSNNPTAVPAAYEARFERAGLTVDREEVLTAGTATTAYLRAEHAADRLFLVGADGVADQLAAAGLSLTDDPVAADALVASIDPEFGYDSLCAAIVALEDPETDFVGTDPDMLIPQAGPDIPGSGAMIHAIEGVTERPVEVICGKPSSHARELALEALGVDAADCLVVGDRLDTDIALGDAGGMTTALVLTGVTDRETLAAAPIQPDHVLDSLAELSTLL
jgi:4-nitrophenyl phosphatase